MNKKIIFASIFVIGMLAMAMGIGTYSYFTSTKSSTGNIFTSGTLNLQLSNDNVNWYDGVTTTWASPSGWAPGDEVTSSIYLRNTGSIAAEAVYAYWNNLVDPDGLSNVINVTWLSDSTWIGENSIGPFITAYDANHDGNLTLAELVYGLSHWNGPKTPDPNQARFYADYNETYEHPVLTANAGNIFEIKMKYKFMETAGNEYQGKSASFDLTLAAWQHHYVP
jgi:predicted ribosomally synthesized peptide with SipW-like signal peptide